MDLTRVVDISVPLTAVFALVVVVVLYQWLRKQEAGTERMQEVARFIQMGSNTFLRREVLTITPFVVVLALLLLIAMPKEDNWQIALGFVVGAALSMVAVYIGMNAATQANVRTTAAARSSAAQALLIAFRGGGVMGLTIVALNLHIGALHALWCLTRPPGARSSTSRLWLWCQFRRFVCPVGWRHLYQRSGHCGRSGGEGGAWHPRG